MLDLMDGDQQRMPPVRSRGLVAKGRISEGAWVQEYGGIAMSDVAAKRLEKDNPELAHWLATVEVMGIKINGCPSDVRRMAEEDWLAPLANHSEDPSCELVVVWVCSTVTLIAPTLVLRALRDLEDGDDITWDYGKSAQIHHNIAGAAAAAPREGEGGGAGGGGGGADGDGGTGD